VIGMAFDKSGNLYTAEWSAGRISRVEPNGKRTTFASDLFGPSGLAIDAESNIYVASYSRDEIYRFTPTATGKPGSRGSRRQRGWASIGRDGCLSSTGAPTRSSPSTPPRPAVSLSPV
jgi:hypothetical protein